MTLFIIFVAVILSIIVFVGVFVISGNEIIGFLIAVICLISSSFAATHFTHSPITEEEGLNMSLVEDNWGSYHSELQRLMPNIGDKLLIDSLVTNADKAYYIIYVTDDGNIGQTNTFKNTESGEILIKRSEGQNSYIQRNPNRVSHIKDEEYSIDGTSFTIYISDARINVGSTEKSCGKNCTEDVYEYKVGN